MGRIVTSALLILVLAVSASACVGGWADQSAGRCSQLAGTHDPTAGHGAPGCRSLQSQPARCGMRDFIQFHFIRFSAFVLSTPLPSPTANLRLPGEPVILVSSVGSPETDRGPPHS